jgi:hypothetical protein
MKEIILAVLGQIPRYFTDLLEVAMSPKRFLKTRCAGKNDPVNDAFIFLGITFIVAQFLQLPLLPNRDDLLKSLATLAALEGLVLFGTLLGLRIAWVSVRGKADLRQLFVCTAYMVGPAMFIMLGVMLPGYALFKLRDPKGFEQFMAGSFEGDTGSLGYRAAVIALLLGFAAAYAWLFVAWGAYRTVNKVSKTRSAIAYIIYTLICIPLLAITVLLAAIIQ